MTPIDRVRHRLGAAVQFVDAFTSKPVDRPLDVRVDALPVAPGLPRAPWRAVPGPNDQTYRFLVTNDTVMPAGNLPVAVTAMDNARSEIAVGRDGGRRRARRRRSIGDPSWSGGGSAFNHLGDRATAPGPGSSASSASDAAADLHRSGGVPPERRGLWSGG